MKTIKSISLLPPEIKARQFARRRTVKLLTGGTVVLLAMLAAYLWLVILTVHTGGEIRDIQSERADVENRMLRYQECAEMESRARQVAGLVQQAMGSPPEWAELVTEVSECMSADLWLTDINVTCTPPEQSGQSGPTGGSPEITLRGWCLDHQSVARWLTRLGQIEELTNIRCQFASEEETEQGAVNFEIKAGVRPGKPYMSSGERGD